MNRHLIWLILLLLTAGTAHAGVVTSELQQRMAASAPDEDVRVIITLADRPDMTQFRDPDRARRRSSLIRDLKRKADQAQAQIRARLLSGGAKGVRQLWLSNSLAATVPARLVHELAGHPGVESVRSDAMVLSPIPAAAPLALPVGWNLTAVGAPDLWALGIRGQGIVVATMDTGVDVDHPALTATWRGGTNSWLDLHGECLDLFLGDRPCDFDGHGTQTMGLIVAGEAGGQAIGVAPGAQWIAVKLFDAFGGALLSHVHQGFQWLLDPDGDPSTDDAPDVVSNSWGLPDTVGACDLEFEPDIAALRAAGIAVVFSAGNDGPASFSSLSPANNPGSIAVGAVDETGTIYEFSSRGPSACPPLGSFPTVVAPGVDVMTTDLSFGGILIDPVLVTGTSFSAPHVAGGIALLKSGVPNATLPALESAIVDTARHPGGPGVKDDVYGAGLIDLVAAYERLNSASTDTVEIIRVRWEGHKLHVRATSSAAPDVILTLPEYGVRMKYNTRKGFYEAVVKLKPKSPRPATVTVVSSGGGSDTEPVPPDKVQIVSIRHLHHTMRIAGIRYQGQPVFKEHRLYVRATSSGAPDVTLTLPEYGIAMAYRSKERFYEAVVRLKPTSPLPATVTVVSSGGGSDTEPLPFKKKSEQESEKDR